MSRLPRLLPLLLCCVAPIASASSPVDLGVGVEMFKWQEFDDGGKKLLEESGPRFVIRAEGEKEVSERWTYGFRGKLYSGTVQYDGQLLNGTPYSTDVDYDGLSGTVDFTGRFMKSEGDYSNWGLRFGILAEQWRRHLLGSGGYSEDYTAVSGRLGFAYLPREGWFGEAGAKYPFSVSEKVKLLDGVSLSPQGAFSYFATVGYNYKQRWSVRGYFDSYRFKASDPATLSDNGTPVMVVYQPRSDMNLFGLSVGLYF